MIEPTDDWLAANNHRRNHTPPRSVRIPDDLWLKFRQIAETNGSTASAVLVAYIRSYIRRHQP